MDRSSRSDACRHHSTAPLRRDASMLATCVLLLCAGACTVSQDQEVSAGEQEAQQVNAQLPIVQDSVVTEYINQLGNRMASRTSRADLPWHFYVVNAAEANAFALPGGFVYVNRGLIDLTHDEAELAGAIGHEIGHVIERHAVHQQEQAQGANLGIAAVCMLTNVCNSNVARAAIQVGGAAAFARNSRKDEAQADSEAVVNTLRAGIDPRGVPLLFQRLLQTRQSQPTVVEGWFADHPLEESRIQHSERIIQAIDRSQLQGLDEDSPAYHAMKSALDALPAPRPAQRRGFADTPVTDTQADTVYQ
jgi:predicted Zn-dependent protease